MENVKSAIYKKGFTLFEVIISFVILSVVLISLIRLNHNENYLQVYYKLQFLENKYVESGMIESSETIKLKD
jgi:prepilin-type N-terminal cleavage/methylation domain-containing protein